MKKLFAVLCLLAVIFALTGSAKEGDILLTVDLISGNMSAQRSERISRMSMDVDSMTFIYPVIYADKSMKTRLEPVDEDVSDGGYSCYIEDGGKLDSIYVLPPARFIRVDTEPVTVNLLDENAVKKSVFTVESIIKSEEWSHKTIEISITPVENGREARFAPKLFVNEKEYPGVPNLRISSENLIEGVTMKYNVPGHIDIRKMELVSDCIVVKQADIQPQTVKVR